LQENPEETAQITSGGVHSTALSPGALEDPEDGASLQLDREAPARITPGGVHSTEYVPAMEKSDEPPESANASTITSGGVKILE